LRIAFHRLQREGRVGRAAAEKAAGRVAFHVKALELLCQQRLLARSGSLQHLIHPLAIYQRRRIPPDFHLRVGIRQTFYRALNH